MRCTSLTSRRWIPLAAVAMLIAACGGSSDSDDGTTPSESAPPDVALATDPVEAPVEASESTETDAAGESGDSADSDGGSGEDSADGGDSGPPDVDTGTFTIAGESYELAGPSRSDVIVESGDVSSNDFDFEICETVNPAFAGDFNIIGTLGDGTPFRLSGNIDEEFGEFNGVFIGDMFEEERADDVELSLSGRTLSGTATTSRGDIEFTFNC